MIYRHRNTEICIINKASLKQYDSNYKPSEIPRGIHGILSTDWWTNKNKALEETDKYLHEILEAELVEN